MKELINKIESLRDDIEKGIETDVIKISVRLIEVRDLINNLYSEEDLKEAFKQGMLDLSLGTFDDIFEGWFEQFKKK